MSSSQMQQLRETMKNMMAQPGMPKMGGMMDFKTVRAKIEVAAANQPTEPGVTFTSETLNGVEAECSVPAVLSGEDIVLYIHGGGFTCNSALTSRGFASQLAGETGLRVWSLSYRLAPENHFPAAPEDCLAVYKALLEKYPGRAIALVGDSAGGNLVMVTTLMARESGLQLPSSVTTFSGCFDMTGAVDHRKYTKTDFTLSSDAMENIRTLYFPDADPANPHVSPLKADLAGFPPLKLVCDSAEVLTVDSEALYAKAKAAGVQVVFKTYDETFHAFATTGRGTPESAEVLADTANFIKEHNR